jgi:3-carboxy-cis,cis-muconate cycloisomerase
MSEGGLFGGILGRGRVAAEVSDRAWLQAMLDVEAALARAQAAAGVVDAAHAELIAAACDAGRYDLDALGAEAAASATPVVALVRALRAQVGGDAAGDVHRGATSQDVLDSAAMLVARRATEPLLDDLAAAAGAAARLADEHRATPMPGRTLLQQAVPITFGLKAAGWLVAVDEASARLRAVREARLAAQLGGAAGTLAGLGDAGLDVLARFAGELGLAEPVLPWHTDRTRIADLAGALAGACGVAAKVARDVTLLAQTEVDEVREGGDDRGGSSAMPHKRNPVAAVSTLAAARQAPGLTATLLAAMEQEHERAAGAWQSEWRALSELLRATGSAAAWLRDMLERLEVDPERMRANIDERGLAERLAAALAPALGPEAAHDVVREAVADATASGRPLAELVAEHPGAREHLSAADARRLLDPATYLGAAEALVERALRAHRELRG